MMGYEMNLVNMMTTEEAVSDPESDRKSTCSDSSEKSIVHRPLGEKV